MTRKKVKNISIKLNIYFLPNAVEYTVSYLMHNKTTSNYLQTQFSKIGLRQRMINILSQHSFY